MLNENVKEKIWIFIGDAHLVYICRINITQKKKNGELLIENVNHKQTYKLTQTTKENPFAQCFNAFSKRNSSCL